MNIQIVGAFPALIYLCDTRFTYILLYAADCISL